MGTINTGRKRKRRSNKIDIEQLGEFSKLTGLSSGSTTDEKTTTTVDDCLAEFQQHQPQRRQPRQRASSKDGNTTVNVSDNSPYQHVPIASWLRSNSCRIQKNQINSWNQTFVKWASGGGNNPYPPEMLPNLEEELARNFKVKELSSFLLQRFAIHDIRMPVFERWLLDSKLEENHTSSTKVAGTDPILPLRASPDSKASQQLLAELLATRNDGHQQIQRQDAEQAVAELCRKTNLFCQELLSQKERYRQQSPLKKGDRIHVEQQNDRESKEDVPSCSSNPTITILYRRKKWKKPFCFKINAQHYHRLKDRFVTIHNNVVTHPHQQQQQDQSTMPTWPPTSLCGVDGSLTKAVVDVVERSFHVLVLAILLRYSAMSGGQLLDDLRGGGMQGSIHSSVFEVLQKHLSSDGSQPGHWLEGFASPFNATLPRFASAFPDLDWHFGAVGSFWDCLLDGNNEFCEANPPFAPQIMQKMSLNITKALQQAEAHERSLTFVVVLPSGSSDEHKTVEETSVVRMVAQTSFQELVTSPYCSKHIRLSAREHGYVEGAQHLRPTMYKTSSYDTSVILLQSPMAVKMSKTDFDTLELDMRHAFTSRHETEVKRLHGVLQEDDDSAETVDSSKRIKLNNDSTCIAGEDDGDSNEKSWSKSKKKRMRKLTAKMKAEKDEQDSPTAQTKDVSGTMDDESLPATPVIENVSNGKSSSIQEAFKALLSGSRFRILNEELYTTTSRESFQRFSQNPELFEQYHQGYRHQVESWPENPVNVIVKYLTAAYASRSGSPCVVADFGCGDAQLAKDLLQIKSKKENNGNKCPFIVHSFDLVAPNKLVTACDMAKVPLPDKSVNVCIFCLSLMGTNLADFVRDAHRVLKDSGRVKIAEVRSRIEYSQSRNASKATNKPDSKSKGTLEEFVGILRKLGFDCIKTDRSNKMFLLLELKKNGKKPDKNLEFSAKPCIYKRR